MNATDLITLLQAAAALVFVLSLIGLAGFLMKKYGPAFLARQTGRSQRLQLVDLVILDAKHRLVLLRRDDIEHLVLLGGANNLVIETGIRRPGFREHLPGDA